MRRSLSAIGLLAALTIPLVSALGGINEWTYVGLAPEYINSIEVDPTNSDIVYVSAFDVYYDSTAEGGLFRTADRGLTWDTLGFRHSNVRDVAVDPLSPWVVWIANDEWGVWRSEDYGDYWVNRSNGIYMGGVDHWGPDKIAVCPHDSRYLMCLTDSWVGSGLTNFTDNAGEQWQELPGMPVFGGRWVTFDFSAPGAVYVTDWNRNYAFISQDTGRSFTQLPPYGYATVYGLKTAPSLPGAVWRMTRELGLQKSIDFGQTWNRDTERFFGSDTAINDMDIVGAGDTMALATWGGAFLTFDGGDSVFALPMSPAPETRVFVIRIISTNPLEIWTVRSGIWTYTCSDTTSSVPEGERSTRSMSSAAAQIWPNPTRGSLQVVLSSMQANPPELLAYNVLGQRISVETSQTVNGWRLQFPPNLSSGPYFLTFRSPSWRADEYPIVYRVVLER